MTVASASPLEAILRRDRAILIGGLGAVIALSWIWILLGAGMGIDAFEMTRLSMRTAPAGVGMGTTIAGMIMAPAAWSIGYALLMVSMWWVMMIAMMLPSAAPMLLMFASINRKKQVRDLPFAPTGLFATGYLVAWGGFSALAAGLQWSLAEVNLLSPLLGSTDALLGGSIFITAGLWQLTPIKQACLRHCRSPIGFLTRYWRPGWAGALRMGLVHGTYCLGCCWFLMGLLFFGGVMNLYWIAGLAAFVLLEKILPLGHWLGRIAGIGLFVLGTVIVVRQI